ncbi:electron transfer flavoprotein subunit beta/FixA family protein [Cellulomonas marina]|uniref:Electron transfer flavoprotein subunit beta n=1 Tax=Cellulomonas marina TaxID=988821 RepID=A0A1I0YL75_9CELL|nr:electron transfer flavoprotein subunit beta/FixA family protein [Cellulomonas marina]SFB13941.1 electron transfer flavoprotein beta subunit [Cellulomonas marina]
MRIVVCVKHVPDIQSERSLGDDGRTVRDGGDGTLNELDENAVEAALALVEARGGDDDEVVALTVGPEDAVEAVRKALQMGAGAAVHVLDDRVAGADAVGTAQVLAAAVRHLGQERPVDLVVLGMAGLDGLTSLLPTMLGELLGVPALPLASALEVEGDAASGGTVQARRDLDHASETLRAPLPAVVSVTDQANDPRYPGFKQIMAARKAPVTVLSLDDLGVDPALTGAVGARTQVLVARPRPPREDRVLVQDTGDGGVRLAQFLVERGLV